MDRPQTPLNTLKLFWAKFFFIYFYQQTQKIYFIKILLVFSIKVIAYSKTFQYLRYKKVFLDENPKTRLLDLKKTPKSNKKKFKMSTQKKIPVML